MGWVFLLFHSFMPGDYFTRQSGELFRYNELTYLFMRRTYYLKKKCSEKPTTTNVKPATMKAPVACSYLWRPSPHGYWWEREFYLTPPRISRLRMWRICARLPFPSCDICVCVLCRPFQQGWSVLTCHPYHCQGVEVVPIHCPPCSPRPAKGRTAGNRAALPT